MANILFFRGPANRIFRALGGTPVYREAKLGVTEQVIAEFNASDKIALGMSPEGTRSKIKQWKTGFLHIALGADVPILLGYFDFKNKRVGLGPLFYPTGDIEADLKVVQDFYKTKQGKYPQEA